jgi:oligopeptidase B
MNRLLFVIVFLTSMVMAETIVPRAARKPHQHTEHGVIRDDPYFWLRQREEPEVIEYLKAENAYAKEQMADTVDLQATLFAEIKGRIKQNDNTYPVQWKNYLYYTRYEDSSEYPFYCRKSAIVENAVEEITFDVPKLAQDHEYFDLSPGEVSPDEKLRAYSIDTEGRRIRTLRVIDQVSGKILPDTIEKVDGGHAWAADSKTLFYSRQDLETLRSYQIWRHQLGTPVADDVLVYEEKDETFDCFVHTEKSEKYIIISSSQTLCDEYRYLASDQPLGEFTLFAPRRRGLEYDITHYGDRFYIRTNRDAENFKIMATPVTATTENNWISIVDGRDDVYLESFEIFDNYLITIENENGLTKFCVRDLAGKLSHNVDFGEPCYAAWVTDNMRFETEWMRFSFSSLKTPTSLFDYNLRTREKRLLKQNEMLGGFKSVDYETERQFVTARDGVKVPLSMIYRKDRFKKDGEHPFLLYAYGSYGLSMPALFQSTLFSLLDRGFGYAIAHVRGGQEMGRHWYEEGKLLKKKNTFNDFVDCGKYLVQEKYTSPEKLCGSGGSAGGMLMGVVANEAPEWFAALVADVPFVDIVTTMLDDTIPLTTSEYDEWGNPHDRAYFDYMLAYSPYDQVRRGKYPAMLVIAGFHDSQVQYWEPAKWVARLREFKTDPNLLLLKTDLESGHGGASGRYEQYKEVAHEQAFLLKQVGMGE